VVIAKEMQESVNGEMGEMVVERLAFGLGFAGRGPVGDDDVADM